MYFISIFMFCFIVYFVQVLDRFVISLKFDLSVKASIDLPIVGHWSPWACESKGFVQVFEVILGEKNLSN